MKREDLQQVNAEVNALPYIADAARYHQPDFWARVSTEGGDCEDFALGKLHRLHALGWSIATLRLACVYVETGEYHAVLFVQSGEFGEFVLDNRYPNVCSLEELQRVGYRPDRIQRAGGSRDWAEWRWETT